MKEYKKISFGIIIALIPFFSAKAQCSLPSITLQPINTTACSGTTATLSVTATGATSYQWYWSGNNNGVVPPIAPWSGQTTQTLTISPITSGLAGQYWVKVTNSCGTVTSSVATVTVSNQVTIPPSSRTVCQGSSTSLTGPSGMTSYSWTGPNGFSSSTQNPTLSNFTSAMSGTYTVTATSGSCTNTGNTTVTITPAPAITTSPASKTVCDAATTTLSAAVTGATSYQWYWSGNNNGVVPPQSPPWSGQTTATLTLSPVAPGMAGQYWLNATNSCGVTTTSSAATVTVDKPTVTPTNSGAVCAGGSITLVPGITAASYSWTGPNGYTSTTSGPVLSNVTTAMSGTYTLTITTSNGCTSSGSTIVTVLAPPSFTVSNNGPVNLGSALNLTGPAGMSSYAWTGPNGFTSTTQSPSVSASATSSMGGVYTLTATNSSGCSNSATTTATVTNPISIGGPASACLIPGSMYMYTAYGPGNGYVWTLPPNMVLVSGGDGQNSITVKFSAPALGINLGVTCTGGSATLPIDVYDVPTGSGVISGLSQVSAGQTGVVYTLSGISPVTAYGWGLPSGATITSGANTSSITVSFPSNFSLGNITVMPINGAGCPANSTVTMAVATGPIPNTPGSIAGNTSVTLGSTNYIYNVAAVTNATSYQWNLPTGATAVSGPTTNSVTVNFSTSFTGGNITVNGKNGNIVGPTSPALYVAPTGYPSPAGTISGGDSQCMEFGDLVATYSVPSIAGATSYNWSVTGGATVVGNSTSNTVDIKFPSGLSASSVTITVNGVNALGSGGPSSKTVTVSKPSTNIGAGKIEPSVDLSTGIMSTGIPLFSISSGDIQVPVELTYTATGVRVTDDDGSVGHNWSLSVLDYRISREVRGLPDDYIGAGSDTRRGWLNSSIGTTIKNFTPSTDNNPATCSDEVANYNALNSFDTNYSADLEPDIFYVSAPGLGFRFYFDEYQIPRALPYQDVVITPNTNTVTGAILSFTVTDSRGVQYTFSELETWTQSMNTPSNYYLVRQTNLYKTQLTYITSWRLSSITSPVYGSVSFTYKMAILNDPSLVPQSYGYTKTSYKYNYSVQLTDGYSGLVNTLYYDRHPIIKILQKVSSADMEAVFTSAPKSSTSLMERVYSIALYDKREGASKLIRSFGLNYNLSGTDRRAFLSSVTASAGCLSSTYSMEYYPGVLPTYDNAASTDDWGFYKKPPTAYSETVSVGSLKRMIYPYKGYDAFFYEPHTYLLSGVEMQGAGLRLKKMISYDGVSSANDHVLEYQYVDVLGKSSGLLQYRAQHNFSVTRLANGWHFRDHTAPEFNLKSSLELSVFGPFHGSAVAYNRTVVKERNNGMSIYMFDVAGTFTPNDWQPSTVSVARPSTGTSSCFELGNIQLGIQQYPFPPDPNHDFEKALLRTVTNVNENGVTERDVTYTYQRVYRNGSSINKIYGLALEEMPTYYFTGSTYNDAKMFLYSKYEIFTDVKTELATQTETIYNSGDYTKKTAITTSYWFESPIHGALTRVETNNSDGSITRKRFKYSKDYPVSTYYAVPASGIPAIALSNLNSVSANRILPVETISSIVSGTEKIVGADLTTYQTLSGKVYPYQQYSFTSTDGTTTFVPSFIDGGSTFQFDQANYILQNTVLNVDSYGNVVETIGRDKSNNAVAFGYNGTLPVIQVSNAGVNEIKYSDFETTSPVNSQIGWSTPVYVTGRNNSKGLLMPVGADGTNMLVSQLSHNYVRPRDYTISAWIKASTAGNLSVKVTGPGIPGSTFTLPFTVSADYKFYQLKIPVASLGSTASSISFNTWTNAAINIDDVTVYPDQSDFVTTTYVIPNGKNSETDSRGVSNYFDCDIWGRVKAMYDQDKNVVKKIDYQVRP